MNLRGAWSRRRISNPTSRIPLKRKSSFQILKKIQYSQQDLNDGVEKREYENAGEIPESIFWILIEYSLTEGNPVNDINIDLLKSHLVLL